MPRHYYSAKHQTDQPPFMPSAPSHPQGIIYIPICHFLFHPFESRNYLKPNEGEGLQVAFFQVRGRRAHTLTYVTEPETRRKGASCALILRLVERNDRKSNNKFNQPFSLRIRIMSTKTLPLAFTNFIGTAFPISKAAFVKLSPKI